MSSISGDDLDHNGRIARPFKKPAITLRDRKSLRLFAALYSLGFQIDGWIPLADLHNSDFAKGWVTYALAGHYIRQRQQQRANEPRRTIRHSLRQSAA
jgi:hypothetical protein